MIVDVGSPKIHSLKYYQREGVILVLDLTVAKINVRPVIQFSSGSNMISYVILRRKYFRNITIKVHQ